MTDTISSMADQAENEHLYATFLLNDLEFAIDVTYVQDAIICPERIISLPASPSYISGIIDIRDTIVPIIDTRKRFKMADAVTEHRGHIAITHCNGRYMGLIFDQISEVIRVKKESRETLAPEFQTEGDLLSEVIKLDDGKRLVQIINPLSLFDYKDLPAQFRQHAARKDAEENISQRQQLVAFESGAQMFGIGVECIREIIVTPDLDQRVLVEEYIKGVISLRDELISIIDLQHFLSGHPVDQTGESRIIILKEGELTFGILVNGIKEVMTYEEKELQPMPSWVGNQHEGGFLGVLEKDGYSIVSLDIAQLFATALNRVAEHTRMHDTSPGIDSSKEKELQENQKPPITYITFELDEVFGVEIANIREIVRLQDNIRHLPGQMDYIQGILNLRAEVIPVINLRHFFNKPSSDNKETLIMIFTCEGKQIAILIDRLLEIRTLQGVDQQDVPKILTSASIKQSQGLVEQVIDIEDRQGNHIPTMIIDVQKFIRTMSEHKAAPTENTQTAAEIELV